jgi:hypothetical protein
MPRTNRTLQHSLRNQLTTYEQLHQCSVCDHWKLKLNEAKSKLAGLAQQFFAKIAEAGKRHKPSLTSAREESVINII